MYHLYVVFPAPAGIIFQPYEEYSLKSSDAYHAYWSWWGIPLTV